MENNQTDQNGSSPELQPENPNQTDPAVQDASVSPSKKLNPLKNKKLLLILLPLVVLAIGGGLYFTVFSNKDESKTTNNTGLSTNNKQESSTNTALSDLLPATWLEEPTSITGVTAFKASSLTKFLNSASKNDVTTLSYLQLGTSNSSRIILARFERKNSDISDGVQHIVLLESKDKKTYQVFQNHSDYFSENWNDEGEPDGTIAYGGPKLASNSSINKTGRINGLTFPDNITFKGATLERTEVENYWYYSGEQGFYTNSPEGYTDIGKTDYGTVLEDIQYDDDQTDTGIANYFIVLKSAAGAYAGYKYVVNELNDDYSLPIIWDDGTKTEDKYRWDHIRYGCGSADRVNVLDPKYIDDLVQRGMAGGKKVYELNSYKHRVIKAFFESYKLTGSETKMTQAKYYSEHGVIAIKNELGHYVLLANEKYPRGGECGKPVIYLYPEAPTNISVGVDADITKSFPTYNNGWRVTALPNGTLIDNNGVYGSLFWEGTGHGHYPPITQGTVVAQSNVKPVLIRQLAEQGLNAIESKDFLDFWLPRIPAAPYVRLTWFGTQEMNQLAPLHLSQKPDTLIRVFLDFEGLSKPTNIAPQKLMAPVRSGFTVVEWGGLLNSK
jgi:uncharacterized protein (UPF0333 family)